MSQHRKAEQSYCQLVLGRNIKHDRHVYYIIANDELIVMHVGARPTLLTVYPSDEQYRHLLIYNRLTRSWTKPLRFPPSSVLSDPCYMLVLVGFLRPRIIVAICHNIRSTPITHHLVLLQISDNLDSLMIRSYIDLPIPYSGHLNCLGFFPSVFPTQRQTADISIAVQVHSLTEEPNGLCYILDCVDRQDGATIRYALPGSRTRRYVFAAMHNGQVYFVRNDGICTLTNDGQCAVVASFAEFCGDLYAFAPRCSYSNGRFIVGPLYDYSQTHVITLIYDLRTKHWNAGSVALPARHGLKIRFFGEEVIVNAMNGRRFTLHSLWALPPKLSTIAMRAVQKRLPVETAEKLSMSKNIRQAEDLVNFLFV